MSYKNHNNLIQILATFYPQKDQEKFREIIFWEIAWGLLLNYKYIQENYKMIENNSLIDKDWNNLIHYSWYIILSAPLLMTFWLWFFYSASGSYSL